MDDAEGGEDSMEFSEVRSSNKRVCDLSLDRASSEGKKPRQVNTRSNSGNHSVVICSMGDLPITAWNNIKFGQAIQQAIGNIKQVKMQGSKELLIICTGPAQVKKALALTSVMGRDVQCRQQLSANQARGVIYGVGDELTEEDELAALKKNKCYKVERLYKGRVKMKTKCMLLHFDLEDIPTEICLGYEIFEVKPYVPRVLRCYKCQGYGHISSSCRGKQRCPRCAGEHEFEQCRNLDRPKCSNCGSLGHSSAYLGCPYRKQTPREWHETFIKFGESVSVNRCQDKDCSCGAQFHCPFCEPKSFKEINAFRVQDHLEQFHWPAGVQYKDLFIVQCLLHCAEKRHAHYHCPVCTDLVEQREEFVTHLQAHLLEQKESVRLAYAPDTQQPEHLVYEDYTLTLCGKDCSIMFSGRKHYHCPGCGELRWNCATIAAHLSECEVLNKHRPHSLFTATKQRQLIDPRVQFAKHWHESMVRDNYDITVRRCTPKCCGKQYHCPLCTSKTKPCMVAMLRKHFSYHLDHSVKHKGYLLLACCLDCVKPGQTDPGTHYHCPYCGKCVPDRVEFTYHLMACEGSTSTSNHDDVEDIPAVDNDFSLEDRDEEWFKVRPKISRPKQQQIEMFETVFATLSQSFLKVFNMETSDALKDMLTEVAGATHVEVCSSPGTDPRRPGFALKGRLQNVLKTESRLSEKFNEVNQDETLTLKTYYTPLPEKPLRSSVSLQTSPVLENVRVKPLPPSRPAPHGQHQTCACPSEPCNAVTDHGYSKEAGNQSKPLNTDEPFHLEKTNINVGSQVALVGKESRTLNNVGQKSTSVVQNTQQAEGNSTEPSKMTISEAVKALSGLAKLIPTPVGLLRSEAQGVHQTFIIPSQGTPQNSLGNAPGAGVHLFQLPGAPSVQLGNSAKANERPSSQSGMSSGKITFVRPKSVAASRLTGSVLTTQTSNENMTDLPVTGSKRPAEVTPADQNMVQKKQDVTEPKRLRIVENVQNVHGHILSPQASSGLNALRKTPVSATVLPSNNSMGITNPASPLKTAELGTLESPKISTAGSKSAPQIRSMAVEDHSNITALIPLQIVPSAKEASEVSDALKYLGGQAKQTNQHPVKQQAVQTSDSSSNCDKASKVADGITVVSSSSNRLSRSVASDKQPIALSTERRLTRSQIVNSDGAKNISFSPIQSASEGPKRLQDSVVNVKSTAVSPLFLQDNSPAATKAAVFSSDQSSSSESPRRYYTRSLKHTRSPELPCKLPTTQNDGRTPNILKRGCTSVISPAKGNSLLVKQNIKLAALTSDCSLDSETLCEKANTSAVKSTVHSQKSESQVAMVSDQLVQILSSDDEQESELIHPDLSFEIPTIRFQLSDAQGTVSSSHSWTKVQGGTQIGKPQTTGSMPSNSVSNGASEPGKTSPELPKRYFTRGRKVDTSVLKGRGKSAKDTTDRKKTPETAKSTRILRSYMSPKKSKKGLVSLPSSKQPESPRKKHLKFETPLKSTKPGTVNKKKQSDGYP
ncbi:uncharacterized protein LOC135475697 [Liolophura sinensis]|uniref:uncharacterized protein LOC135475697 n=1 Tax=Liolophura sinensis TaxID=3198878 RepID=UPI0031591658